MILAVEEDPLASSKFVHGTLAVGHKVESVANACLPSILSALMRKNPNRKDIPVTQ